MLTTFWLVVSHLCAMLLGAGAVVYFAYWHAARQADAPPTEAQRLRKQRWKEALEGQGPARLARVSGSAYVSADVAAGVLVSTFASFALQRLAVMANEEGAMSKQLHGTEDKSIGVGRRSAHIEWSMTIHDERTQP